MESAGGRPEAAAAAVLKVKGRDAGRRPNGAHSSSSCLQHRHSRRTTSASYVNAPDVSPRLSAGHIPAAISRSEVLDDTRRSLDLPDQFPEHRVAAATERAERSGSKSAADLAWEIAVLEEQVVRKELHLLSLYRAAFDQYLGVSPRASAQEPRHERSSRRATAADDEGALRLRSIKESASYSLPTLSDSKRVHAQELSRCSSGRSSLANFLSASIAEYVPKISCKLSEDILRCVSAVYCKLASRPLSQEEEEARSETPPFTPSLSVSSASSSFSLKKQHPVRGWSPRCYYNADATATPDAYASSGGSSGRYSGVMVFPGIHVDEEKFEYACKMLDTIRSLIKRLEKIDPRKMAHEEQLCFWVNIHNALVMHAFMAYGLQEKRMKSTDLILKAAYNVGGHSVNSQTIQNSILGCQSHRPSLWVRTLFTPTKKSGSSIHPYALQYAEPIAHFALSTGAFSDPPVRLYTAKKLYHQLEQARAEFIQANVMVRRQTIFLPKVLHFYAKDASLELPDLVDIVCESMPELQRKEIRQYLRRRIDKCVQWLPYKSSFRYTVHSSLAE
ncbi:uncharacterized isoform X1 [Zea mays]|uniref:uncharacterized isoform X1 n=1 Tax=Zea mays TaxID=4577 RepID=UPI0002218368|nr:uncharacterized protein LOC100193686 isoform X1 [Zea mays]XP_020406886.1 uncharacterized protein LOC100193686 isoform X1 [Zea mays]XP_020406887.1 uncharacterized protein LOC100193686 isoform X1 [Zea mays]|eukprot:XP_008676583.1 uncharacterized LOC100193686 isoform X1 [Zea mays]